MTEQLELRLSQRIKKARDFLETQGWTKGYLSKIVGDERHYCMGGAFLEANNIGLKDSFLDLICISEEDLNLLDTMRTLSCKVFGVPVGQYNDELCKTKQDALDGFAILEVEAEYVEDELLT